MNPTRSALRGYARLFCHTALITTIAFPSLAMAQDAQNSQDQSAQSDDEAIVVTGSRASREQALQLKRDAVSIIDAVSSDNVGKLPDYNPAEAIQRLPGLSTQLDQGEPRYAVIRGVDPNLNDVTVDGNLVGAPEAEGRRVSLDTIPSDLVSAIEVVKAVTPDMDANAVGGRINIVTPSAFARNDDFLFASLRGSYNKKADRLGYGGSVSYGTQFGGDDQFGIVLAGSYNKRRFETELAEAIDWAPRGAQGIFSPTNVRLFQYDITRERIGAVLNLEFRPSDAVQLYVRNIFTEFTDEENRDQADFETARGTLTVLSPTSLSFSQGRLSREFRRNEQTQRIYNISPGGDFTFGNATLSLNYTHGRAEELTPVRNDAEFRSPSNTTLAHTINIAGPRVSFDAIGAGFDNPSNYPLRRILLRQEEIVEKLNAVRADLKIGLGEDENSFIKIGAKYVVRDKLRDSRRDTVTAVVPFNLASANIALPAPTNFFGGAYPFGPRVDYGGTLALLASNAGNFVVDPQLRIADQFNLDYTIKEKILAAYVMGSTKLGDLGIVGGVRLERTNALYNAFGVFDADGDGTLEASDIAPLSGRNRYTDILPSLHLNYAASDDWQLRAAWTNTIGRPNYDQAVPTFAADDDEGSAGNPDLEPFRAMGLDLSAEFYPDRESIISTAIFYKKIENPIFTRTTFNTVFNGQALDILTQPENADSGWLLGLEANLQYRFASLPSPFDGMGVSVNGTYVKSRVDVIGREADKLPFFRQSKWIANAALFYEKGPFEARIALTYRSPYLEAIGANRDQDIYFDKRTQWDAKISYRITEELEMFGSVSNFTTTARREYQGIRARRLAEELYGPTFNFGISANF